jgi:hypothetical protein
LRDQQASLPTVHKLLGKRHANSGKALGSLKTGSRTAKDRLFHSLAPKMGVSRFGRAPKESFLKFRSTSQRHASCITMKHAFT